MTALYVFDDAWMAKCLDHAASKKPEQIVPSVTGKVYNHSKRMKEKRAVLDGVARPSCGGSSARPQKPNWVWSPDYRPTVPQHSIPQQNLQLPTWVGGGFCSGGSQ